DAHGAIQAESVERALARDQTALVALMQVNNETGALLDTAAVGRLTRETGAAFVCDAVQAAGLEDVSFQATMADVVTLSAHKVGGPKGAGALALAEGIELTPELTGGAQERGLRPGTHAVSAIVGLGAALALAESRRSAVREHLAR